MKETLRHNAKLIDEWFLTAGVGESIQLRYQPSSKVLTGYGVKRGRTTFEPTDKMQVWLVRTQNGYIIDKYYPSFE
ncbi:MAG: hypothetical protein JNK86_07985 [Alphaproteobacteria bacterium]|nr:hypothetical protein [Alphaproteobacteria bacterium]